MRRKLRSRMFRLLRALLRQGISRKRAANIGLRATLVVLSRGHLIHLGGNPPRKIGSLLKNVDKLYTEREQELLGLLMLKGLAVWVTKKGNGALGLGNEDRRRTIGSLARDAGLDASDLNKVLQAFWDGTTGTRDEGDYIEPYI